MTTMNVKQRLEQKTEQAMKYLLGMLALSVLIIFPDTVLATQITGFSGPMDDILATLTGPVMSAIATIAMVAAAAALMFGGEMSDLVRRIIMVVLAIAFIVTAGGFISAIFTNAGTAGTGALI